MLGRCVVGSFMLGARRVLSDFYVGNGNSGDGLGSGDIDHKKCLGDVGDKVGVRL